MKNWLQRVIALLLLSAGLASLLFPFRDYRLERIPMTVATAKAIGIVEKPENLWEPGAEEVQSFPAEVLATLDDASFEGTRTLREPGENVASFFPPDHFEIADNAFHLLYRDRLFLVRNQVAYHVKFAEKYGAQSPTDLPEIVHLTALGKLFPPDSGKAITPRSLQALPALRTLFERSPTGEFLPFETWREFAGAGQTRAVYDGRLFEIQPADRSVDVEREIAGLEKKRLALGAGGAVIGLILLIVLYRRKPGVKDAIQIGTPGQQIAGDAIVAAIGMIAMVPWLDTFLHRTYGVETIADEEFGRFMGAFFLAIAVPAVSLYLSMIGAQWFTVDDETIRLRSLLSDRSIPWDELDSVESEKSHIGTVKADVPVVRTLQKSLVFLSRNRTRIAVMEPTKGVKRDILALLERHAPDPWKPALAEAGEKWMGYEPW